MSGLISSGIFVLTRHFILKKVRQDVFHLGSLVNIPTILSLHLSLSNGQFSGSTCNVTVSNSYDRLPNNICYKECSPWFFLFCFFFADKLFWNWFICPPDLLCLHNPGQLLLSILQRISQYVILGKLGIIKAFLENASNASLENIPLQIQQFGSQLAMATETLSLATKVFTLVSITYHSLKVWLHSFIGCSGSPKSAPTSAISDPATSTSLNRGKQGQFIVLSTLQCRPFGRESVSYSETNDTQRQESFDLTRDEATQSLKNQAQVILNKSYFPTR